MWERKAWYDNPPVSSAPLIRLEPAKDTPLAAIAKDIRPLAFRRLRFVRHRVTDDQLRTRALVKWRAIIQQELRCSHVGRQLSEMCDGTMDEDFISSTMTDVFACKATATLFKRSTAMLRYLAWANDNSVQEPMSIREPTVYTYLKYLQSSLASATSGSSFLEALNFSKAVIGLDLPSDVCCSPRIKGVVHQLALRKRTLHQAEPLTVNDVEALERMACQADDAQDRVAAGHFCMALYSSARFGDTQ